MAFGEDVGVIALSYGSMTEAFLTSVRSAKKIGLVVGLNANKTKTADKIIIIDLKFVLTCNTVLFGNLGYKEKNSRNEFSEIG